MGFYRVLEGKHYGKGPADCECNACVHSRVERKKIESERKEGREYTPRLQDHAYKAGDIVETEHDLLAFNQPPHSMKFEKVDSVGRPVSQSKQQRKKQPVSSIDDIPTGDGLDEMTVQELRTMAEEEEIDLGSATRKDEIIGEIRRAMVQQSAEAGFRS